MTLEQFIRPCLSVFCSAKDDGMPNPQYSKMLDVNSFMCLSVVYSSVCSLVCLFVNVLTVYVYFLGKTRFYST